MKVFTLFSCLWHTLNNNRVRRMIQIERIVIKWVEKTLINVSHCITISETSTSYTSHNTSILYQHTSLSLSLSLSLSVHTTSINSSLSYSHLLWYSESVCEWYVSMDVYCMKTLTKYKKRPSSSSSSNKPSTLKLITHHEDDMTVSIWRDISLSWVCVWIIKKCEKCWWVKKEWVNIVLSSHTHGCDDRNSMMVSCYCWCSIIMFSRFLVTLIYTVFDLGWILHHTSHELFQAIQQCRNVMWKKC